MRDPTKTGPYGRAWLLKMQPSLPAHAACLGMWLIHAPKSHLIWPWRLISVIHLRDIEGVPPATKRYADATHELIVMSIDPEACPNPDPDAPDNHYPTLRPIDVVEQFHGLSDLDAAHLLELSVQACLDGYLAPDEDYRSAWSAAIQATAQHMREGAHIRN